MATCRSCHGRLRGCGKTREARSSETPMRTTLAIVPSPGRWRGGIHASNTTPLLAMGARGEVERAPSEDAFGDRPEPRPLAERDPREQHDDADRDGGAADVQRRVTCDTLREHRDRKSTRLNSSHVSESRMPS